MQRVGAVRLLPGEKVYKRIFEDEVRLVRSLDEARNKTRLCGKSERLILARDSEASTDAGLLPCYQQTWAERTPYGTTTEKPPLCREATTFQKAAEEVRGLPEFVAPDETVEKKSNILESLPENRRGRHAEALTSMYHELACIARELEPFVLEHGKVLLAKLMESDRKMELLFNKIELDTTLEGFSMEDLEDLWNIIHQESLTRKKWVREMDESLKRIEWSRADKITDVLRKYTVILEEISFFLSADVYRLINDEAMMINRALLANQRAIAQLFFNLIKSEMKRELSYRLKWQDRVKDWKLIKKNSLVHNFREFMANEEIQNPPTVKTEMENMITEQILLSERRLELLQHLGDLLPPAHTKADINEWYRSLVNLNKSMDTHHAQFMMKIHIQYETVLQKCSAEVELCKNNLMNVCTKKEAEETVNSEILPLTEKLKNRFKEELEHMDRDFEELAKHNEQNCRELCSYFQEAVDLWDVHQLKLSQQESELQKKLNECRKKRDNFIKMMEDNLDKILDEMRTASSKENLNQYLEDALCFLDDIRARYETLSQVLLDTVVAYPEAILQELISYSISISQYFKVKEVFKQNLQGEVDLAFQDQELAEAPDAEHPAEQQADSIVQENEGKQEVGSHQRAKEESGTAENEKIFTQETGETEYRESIPHESEETEHAGNGVNFTQAMVSTSKAENSEIAAETFSTSSGNTYTVLGVEEAGKTDISETYFTKYEKTESLPVYLKHALIKQAAFVELKKWIRLCFFEHLEKWFAESLSNSCVVVHAKKEKLNSELQLRLHLHHRRQEDIERDIYNIRAAELLLHKKRLDSHCAGVVEALKKEKAEFLQFCDGQKNISKNLHSQIRDMESVLLRAPMTEKFVSFNNSLHSELHNHLEMIRVSMRSYRNYLEEALGKLRDSNVDFLRACRLFLEGGNFSPEEVKSFSSCIQEESKRIDSFERSAKTSMEKMESRWLGQATELIKQSEKKFRHIFMNRVFMEKIQRFLTNLQVQIKSEVAKSNLQAVTLNSHLEKLRQKIDACSDPTAVQEALTSEDWYDFIKVVVKELKKRRNYLDCLLVKAMMPRDSENFTPLAATDVTLQGPIAVAIRKQSVTLQDPTAVAIQKDRVRDVNELMLLGLDPSKHPLLNPSRMGKSALDDLSIGVIKNLLGISPTRKYSDVNRERRDRSHSIAPGRQMSAAQITRRSSYKRRMSRVRKQSTKPVLDDNESQIFGEKPPESDTFKGIITNILWTANNSLLCLAEEFYKKGKPHITIDEDLPQTFERCVEVLMHKLLAYQRQTDDYHNSCILEFQDQLLVFEKLLPYVSQLAIDSLLKEHEQKLSCSTGQIRHLFNKQVEDWENVKAIHNNQLRPSLGHPDNLPHLDALCQAEIKRQEDQADGTRLNRQKLQDCAAECAQNFVSALAAFTKKLLLEFDESVTVDDIQVPKIELPREKLPTLIRRKQAGLPLEIYEVKQLIDRGSRTWPGLPRTTLADNSGYILCRETASFTAAKNTLGHGATIEARDAVYKKYKCKLEQQFAQIKEESTAQLLAAQRWEDWWKRSIRKIKELYT